MKIRNSRLAALLMVPALLLAGCGNGASTQEASPAQDDQQETESGTEEKQEEAPDTETGEEAG